MAIHFKIIARKNPQDPAAAPKYYAQAVANGKRDLEGLAERISWLKLQQGRKKS